MRLEPRVDHDPGHHLAARPYVLLYRQGRENFCPGCGQAQWFVGRNSAECAFCATVLPLRDGVLRATGEPRVSELIA